MQDYDEVKEDFERKEKTWFCWLFAYFYAQRPYRTL
jgi:hypothetical protein